MIVENMLPEMIAKEIKDRQDAVWERLHKKAILEIKNWADLAYELDAILDDLIEYFKPD